MEHEVEIRERLASLEQDSKSMHRRIDNLEQLTESVHIIATETKAMRSDVNEITARVDEIEKKPIRRCDTAVTAVITAVIGAVIGALIGYFM